MFDYYKNCQLGELLASLAARCPVCLLSLRFILSLFCSIHGDK